VLTVARGENYIFQRFYPFLAFENIQNNVWLHFDTRCTWGKNGVYGANVEIIQYY
jgi:hypothetical protein